jgi:hypothetical protein
MVETYGAHECRVYFVEETNYGETPSTPTMLGVNTSNAEPGLDPGLMKVRGIGSRDLQSLVKGLRNVTLKLSDCLSSESPIAFLQHIQTLKSLSVQVLYYKGLFASATDVISFLYKGCRMNKLTVQCSIEDVVKASAELVGQDIQAGTSKITGATYGDYAGAVPFHESYVKRGDPDGSNLTVVDRVTDWSFTIENNLKPVPVIRSTSGHLLKYLRERHRNIYGEAVFEFESKAEFDDVVNDTEFSLCFRLGDNPSNGEHTVLLKYCKWQNVSTPSRIEDLVALKAAFVAKDVFIS